MLGQVGEQLLRLVAEVAVDEVVQCHHDAFEQVEELGLETAILGLS